jgi:predicted Zn finger-like uncharacterized protein
MILTCPQCATRYQVDAAQFAGPGRKVRCAKCGHVWHQVAPPPEPEPGLESSAFEATPPESPPPATAQAPSAPVVEPRPAAYAPTAAAAAPAIEQEQAAPRRRGVSSVVSVAGWFGLIALVALLGWAGVHYRQQIVTAWPQAASLYSKFGLPVNARGIAFAEVAYRRASEGGQQVLSVSGKLVNVTAREQPVPELRVVLTDDDSRELYHWNFSAGVSTLRPGQKIGFLTRLTSPPAGARHLEVRFTEAGS